MSFIYTQVYLHLSEGEVANCDQPKHLCSLCQRSVSFCLQIVVPIESAMHKSVFIDILCHISVYNRFPLPRLQQWNGLMMTKVLCKHATKKKFHLSTNGLIYETAYLNFLCGILLTGTCIVLKQKCLFIVNM